MASFNFEINQRLEIIINGISFKSNIEDIDEYGIYIDIPYSNTKYNYEIFIGMKINFIIILDNEIVKCKGEVTGRKKEGILRFAYISKIVVVENIQRREYFRFPVTLRVYYYMLDKEKDYCKINDIPIQCYEKLKHTLTIDLSGGGIKIISKVKYKIGEKVLLRLDIPQSVYLIGEIIRCERNNIFDNYRISIKFSAISEGSRNKIIKFIFDKSREKNRIL